MKSNSNSQANVNRSLRILFVLPYITQTNGILTFCWSFLGKLISDGYQVSIVSTDIGKSEAFVRYCSENQVPLFLLPSPKTNGVLNYLRSIRFFMKTHHDYDIIHCNVTNYGFFYLKAAKKWKIPVRILHSHSKMGSATSWKNKIDNIIKMFSIKEANVYFACSNGAGLYLFKHNDFYIIRNAIDFSKFSNTIEKRAKSRQILSISNEAVVIGVVARMAPHKNPLFSLQVFNYYHKKHENSFLVYVGSGELKEKIIIAAASLKIDQFIRFTGPIPDPENYYPAFDCCILPSISEGFGTTVVEAQAAGIPQLVSTEIPQEAVFSNNVLRLPLSKGPEVWADNIDKVKSIPQKIFTNKKDFEIVKEAEKLESIYNNEYKKKVIKK